ncbi:MAG: hypothetical protein WBV77_15925 [Solirubrobacteraceae bacterium]
MLLPRAMVAALIGCFCFASTATAADTTKLNISFVPDRAGARTTIDLALRVIGPHGTPPQPVTSFDLRLPASMGLASTSLGEANCEPAALFSGGLTGCSPNARLGFGTATAVVPVGAQTITEHATLDALLGQPGEDRIEVLFYIQAGDPVFAQLVLPSIVEEAAPPYGEQLATSVPLVEAWPEGPDLALETFVSSIGPRGLTYYRHINGRTVAHKPRGFRIPKSCPAGGYPFEVELTFADGTQSAATHRVPCPPR